MLWWDFFFLIDRNILGQRLSLIEIEHPLLQPFFIVCTTDGLLNLATGWQQAVSPCPCTLRGSCCLGALTSFLFLHVSWVGRKQPVRKGVLSQTVLYVCGVVIEGYVNSDYELSAANCVNKIYPRILVNVMLFSVVSSTWGSHRAIVQCKVKLLL